MEYPYNISRKHAFLPLLFLHAGYFLLFHFVLLDINPYAILISTILVLFYSILYGRFYGLLSGMLIDTAVIVSFSARQLLSISLSANQLPTVSGLPDLNILIAFPLMGLLVSILVDFAGVKVTKFEKIAKDTYKKNVVLNSQIKKFEENFRKLSVDRIYNHAWNTLIDNKNISEPIISLILSSLDQEKQIKMLSDGKSIRAERDNIELNSKLFDLLATIRPEILAILDCEGKILHYNKLVMAIYGQAAEQDLRGSSLLDLFYTDSISKARENLSRIAKSELDQSEKYVIKSIEGPFSKVLISSEVYFETIENPISVAVYIRDSFLNLQAYNPDHDLYFYRLKSSQVTNLTDLIHADICCISPFGYINYISPQFARTMGYQTQNMLSHHLDQYVSKSFKAQYDSLLQSCCEGQRSVLEIEMISHDGKPCELIFDAFPSVDDRNNVIGITIVFVSLSGVKKVEDELNHRLTLEKLISSISTRFVSIRSEEIDHEIVATLKKIEEFEEARECSIVINKLNRISQKAEYRSRDTSLFDNPDSSLQSSLSNHYELVSVPILLDSENVGCLKLYKYKYQDNWISSDLKLIRIVGEIIISSLIRRENEMEIRLNENRLSTTLHSIGDAVIASDIEGRIILMNNMAENLTGWSWGQARFRQVDEIFLKLPVTRGSDTHEMIFADRADRSADTDNYLLKSRDGSKYFISVTQTPVIDKKGLFMGTVIVFRDISQKKAVEDKVRYISYHDNLTDLYNRTYFEEELIRLNTVRQYPISIILCDCNGLKIANDVFGHLEGDKLLKTIASILKKATRHEDIVARWGGDEFAAILPKTDEKAASVIQERIIQLCLESEQDPIQPSVAIGFATNTDGSNDLIQLLKTAEERMYQDKLKNNITTKNALIQSIEKMVYEKNIESQDHADRMRSLAQVTARTLDLTEIEQSELSLLAALHDIGKAGVPDSVLLKPGKLSAEEWEIIKKHSDKGYNLAKSTPDLMNIADAILYHHEHWDGSGYPAGLKGENIPKLSRILSIMDAFDVMTHPQIYKLAQSTSEALKEIKKCAGSQFDPEISEIFVKSMEESHVNSYR